jgi:hypothetical protein
MVMDTATQLTMLAPLARGLAGGASATRPEVNVRPKASEPDLTSEGIEDAVKEIVALDKSRKPVRTFVSSAGIKTIPIDPYAQVKAAYAAGKTIQILMPGGVGEDRRWEDWAMSDIPAWSGPPSDYRVKPERDLDEVLADGAKLLARVIKTGRGGSGHMHSVGTLVTLSKGNPGQPKDYLATNGKTVQWLFRDEFEVVSPL